MKDIKDAKGDEKGKEKPWHKISIKLPFSYKRLILIPLALLILSVFVLSYQYYQTGEWFKRSIELRGGTQLNIKSSDAVDIKKIDDLLSRDFGSVNVRELRGFGEYGALIEFDDETDYNAVLDRLRAGGIDVSEYSVEKFGASISSVFWSQAQIGIIISFVLMAIFVFLAFRTLVPSLAVIASAASDIIMTLAGMQAFGIEFSLASLGALLMLIGYSVDTDIMLTTRVLRETEKMSVDEKILGAIKTGLTMTLTSIGAVLVILIIPLPEVLVNIASIIFLGLMADILNTWLMNSVLLKWYAESRGAA